MNSKIGRNKINLTGQKFGRLLVLKEHGKTKHGNITWECVCDCGNSGVIAASNPLRRGNTKSCGCLQKEFTTTMNTTHGKTMHPLYRVWRGMLDRCYNLKHKYYMDYGGRGITVCNRWRFSVEYFIEDVSEGYEKGLQLDRRDNDGNYEPDNIRWVTNQQNQFNTRSRSNSTSQYKGVCWHKNANKWVANIGRDGKDTYLGIFSSEKDAALAYNKAALELFGEYANLNTFEL